MNSSYMILELIVECIGRRGTNEFRRSDISSMRMRLRPEVARAFEDMLKSHTIRWIGGGMHDPLCEIANKKLIRDLPQFRSRDIAPGSQEVRKRYQLLFKLERLAGAVKKLELGCRSRISRRLSRIKPRTFTICGCSPVTTRQS